jgi:phosphoribosyl 1,2-cyclic phosphodiesterase
MDGSDLVTTRRPAENATLEKGADTGLTLRFWGVRGSIPCAGRETMRYGGNTSAVEVVADGRTLILDGGTGIRYLGRALVASGRSGGDVFLSHSHFDHVCGLPFFAPFFEPGQSWRIWSGHLENGMTTRELMDELMRPPLFPVPPEIFSAQVACRDFRAGDTLEPLPGVRVRTAPLNHPNGATGYRIEHDGRSVCYVTDTEHHAGELDRKIVALARDADVLIYDSSYTDAEYQAYAGRGHSTWEEGARLADAAKVKTYIAFHHDPEHDDAFLDEVAVQLVRARPGSLVAREGLTLQV